MSFKRANKDLCLQILKGVFRQKRKRQDRKSVSVWWRLIIRKRNEWKDNVLIRKQSFLVLLASVFVCQTQLLLNIIKMVQKIAYFLWVFLLLNKNVLKKKEKSVFILIAWNFLFVFIFEEIPANAGLKQLGDWGRKVR